MVLWSALRSCSFNRFMFLFFGARYCKTLVVVFVLHACMFNQINKVLKIMGDLNLFSFYGRTVQTQTTLVTTLRVREKCKTWYTDFSTGMHEQHFDPLSTSKLIIALERLDPCSECFPFYLASYFLTPKIWFLFSLLWMFVGGRNFLEYFERS